MINHVEFPDTIQKRGPVLRPENMPLSTLVFLRRFTVGGPYANGFNSIATIVLLLIVAV